jgi:hypothetical protein
MFVICLIHRRKPESSCWEDITTPRLASKGSSMQTSSLLTCSDQSVRLGVALTCILGFRSLDPRSSASCIQSFLLWFQVGIWDDGCHSRIAI